MIAAFLSEVSEGMAGIMHVKTMMLRDTAFKQLCSKTAQVLGGMGMSWVKQERDKAQKCGGRLVPEWRVQRINGHFPELRVSKGWDLQRSVLSCCLLHCKSLPYIKPSFLILRTNINRTLSSKEVISVKQGSQGMEERPQGRNTNYNKIKTSAKSEIHNWL